MSEPTLLERAFQLAREGECRTIDDIRRRLMAEHSEPISSHLDGTIIKRQLRAAMANATK